MENKTSLIQLLSNQVVVVGVSKNRTLNEISALYQQGITIFGENKVQELESKYRDDQPWQWHFIGHLQRNKVTKAVSMCTMIQSVDSIRLAIAIDKAALNLNKTMDILIQVNVLDETTKFGCALEDLASLANSVSSLKNLRLRGFMIMGPTTQSKKQTALAFKKGHELFASYKRTFIHIDTLSMGMSNDYNIALKEGSTMVRLGSILFTTQKTPNHNK